MTPRRSRNYTDFMRVGRALGIVLALLLVVSSCATAPVSDDRRKGLAVWDVEDVTPGGFGIDMGELMTARMIETLQKNSAYRVVERTRLLRVLEELRIGSSALADERTRLRVGNVIGARFMIFGGYMVAGGKMRLDVRLVEVETGRILKAVRKTALSGSTADWLDAAARAAAEF